MANASTVLALKNLDDPDQLVYAHECPSRKCRDITEFEPVETESTANTGTSVADNVSCVRCEGVDRTLRLNHLSTPACEPILSSRVLPLICGTRLSRDLQ